MLTSINTWDVICLSLIAISAISGYLRGFILDTGQWASALLAIFTSYRTIRPLHIYHWQKLTVGGTLFTAFWVTLLIICNHISKKILQSPAAVADRTFGAIGGVARALIILTLLFGILESGIKPLPKEIQHSQSYSGLLLAWKYLQNTLRQN